VLLQLTEAGVPGRATRDDSFAGNDKALLRPRLNAVQPGEKTPKNIQNRG
jgi:hypothetical protein